MLPPIQSCVVTFQSDNLESTEASCSGIFIKEDVVLAPACILADTSEFDYKHGRYSITHLSYYEDNVMCKPKLALHKASLITVFTCEQLSESLNLLFRDAEIKLSADSKEKDDHTLLSKFILLKKDDVLVDLQDQSNYKHHKIVLLKSISMCNAVIGERLLLCSTPFGKTNPDMFLNTWTSGIVASRLDQRGLLLCDISCVPGSQGGIVYKICKTSKQVCAVAMVLHPIIWRYQEPSGLCIAGALDNILNSLMQHGWNIDGAVLTFNACEFHKSQGLIENMGYLVKVVMQSSWGSGIFMSHHYILTCAHVIKGHQNYLPRIKHPAVDTLLNTTVVYCSQNAEDFDIAILKLSSSLLPPVTPIKLADSMEVGENVVACGYGMFKDQCYPIITSGILSKVATSGFSVISSCHVHSGSSGGALLNAKRELVALLLAHTMTTDDTERIVYTNLSFAIPVSLLRKALSELISYDSFYQFLVIENRVRSKL